MYMLKTCKSSSDHPWLHWSEKLIILTILISEFTFFDTCYNNTLKLLIENIIWNECYEIYIEDIINILFYYSYIQKCIMYAAFVKVYYYFPVSFPPAIDAV